MAGTDDDAAAPSLSLILRRATDAASERLRVWVPGRVLRYDSTTTTVDVQVLVRRARLDADPEDDPVLLGLPVLWPGAALGGATFPLADGDQVAVLFGDRDLQDWALQLLTARATAPTPSTPRDARTHDISDSVAVPIRTFSAAARVTQASRTRMVVEWGDAQVSLATTGHVAIGRRTSAGVTVELLDLFDQVLARLQLATTATMLGAQPLDPTTLALLAAVRTNLATIRGVLV